MRLLFFHALDMILIMNAGFVRYFFFFSTKTDFEYKHSIHNILKVIYAEFAEFLLQIVANKEKDCLSVV